jgi:hypothetical protein
MASMPHYLSVGVNSLAADGVTKTINGTVDVLNLVLTSVEEMIYFLIDMLVGTYACLIAAFIHGGLEVGTIATQDTSKFFSDAINTITNAISSDIGKIQDTINQAFSTAGPLVSGFGGHINPPTIDISGHLNDLKNIKVTDTQFVQDLVQLDNEIPTFDQVQNATKQALAIPFNLIRQQLNNSYAGYTFDRTIFPVADKESLSFCSNNSFLNDFFQALFDVAATAKIVFIVILLLLAILACVPKAFLEIRRWRRQQRTAHIVAMHGYDPMDVVYISSRPFTATVGIKLASRFSGKRQILVRWAVAYATSLPAIFVLSIALAGLFSCLCQFILMRAIEKEAPALANEVGDFAGSVVTTLERVSAKWATDANGVITKINTEINNDLFGWVDNATLAVNDTLNTFTAEMNQGIDAVFKNTILNKTITDVIRCLVGLKIESIQKGLAWVQDHARVNFPLFPNDTFAQGAQESIQGDSNLTSFLASPSSVTTDEITAAVQHVIDTLHNHIIQQALLSTGLLLVYVITVMLGIIRALSGMVLRDKTRGEGGQRYVGSDDIPAAAGLNPRGSKRSKSDADQR